MWIAIQLAARRAAAHLLLSAFVLAWSGPAAAQGDVDVTISRVAVTCQSLSLTYLIASERDGYTASLQVFGEVGLLASVEAPAQVGQAQTAGASFDAQPEGTGISAVLTVFLDGEPVASEETVAEPCSQEPYPGFSDGRLNPDPDESYAAWCAFDYLEVWRTTPTPLLLTTIPILFLIDLDRGSCLDETNGVTTCRLTPDVITLSGENGNRAPEPGQKSFSLSECIARNGGVPEGFPEPPSGPMGEEPVDPPPTVSPCERLELADFLECLATRPDLSSLELCWLGIYMIVGDLVSGASARVQALAAGGLDRIALYRQLSRLRDEVFAQTAGGRRATDLYFEHSPDLLHAAIAHPEVVTTGFAALAGWAPIVEALVGDGATGLEAADEIVVSNDQAQQFDDFLEAVRAAAGPALRVALEREILLVEPASFAGSTAAEMLARLERVSCAAEPTLASLRCRLGDLTRAVQGHVAGEGATRLARWLTKIGKKIDRVESSSARSRRLQSAFRQLTRVLGRAPRVLAEAAVVRDAPEAVRLVVAATAPEMRTDAETLAP
jgi:hypothetical protein